MKVTTATSAGHAGRANEDFVGVTTHAVVLLDGAGIPGSEGICHHGTAWFAHTLGETLVTSLERSTTDLRRALAESIEQVADGHRHTCDIADPSSPQATVAMIRFDGDHLDWLVLADSYVVLATTGGDAHVLTDPREVTVRHECAEPLVGLATGSAAYEEARRAAVASVRARRNAPGGYWIAKDDPQAAAEAVTGRVDLADLSGVALLSNGAARVVDPYRLADWPTVLELLRTDGPDALLNLVRRAEAAGAQASDDATVAYIDLLR